MRHLSPETKRRYQLAMTKLVRERIEEMNEPVYGQGELLQFYDSGLAALPEQAKSSA